jgi:hypothetical protein
MEKLPRLTVETLLSVIQSKPASFFGHSVRHLYLREVPNEAFFPILSACTAVENLWIRDVRMDWMPSITSLTLKHFYGHLKPILKTISPPHLFFSQLTHIEVLGMAMLPSLDDTGIWSALGLIPGLTHLSFNDEDCIPICSRLLETCKLLSVLIVLNGRVKPSHKPYAAILAHDVRFLVMDCLAFLEDWQMGAHTGRDYWSRAEHFISRRRSGEIDRECLHLFVLSVFDE